jgi:hypothetical protein
LPGWESPSNTVARRFPESPPFRAGEVQYPNELTEEEERFWTHKGAEAIATIAGRPPVGYRPPWYKYSKSTTNVLADAGFLWDTSLMGDDIPYMIRSTKGELVELPSRWQLDDWPQFVHNHDLDFMMPIASPQYAMEVYMAEFTPCGNTAACG